MLNQEFNTWLHDYNERIRRWVPYYDQLLSTMLDATDSMDAKDILDLGCGNGNVSAVFLEQYPQAHYLLVDASEDMISAVKRRFGDKAEMGFMEKYFQDLSLMDASFDVIAAGLSLHHLHGPEKQEVFASIYEWLKPGGVFVSGDLYASKENPSYKEEVIDTWEAHAKERGTTQESWETLLDHHLQFDFPDEAVAQMEWLKTAGFNEVSYQELPWKLGVLKARKF